MKYDFKPAGPTKILSQEPSSIQSRSSPHAETGELLNIAEDFLRDPLMRHLSTSPEYSTNFSKPQSPGLTFTSDILPGSLMSRMSPELKMSELGSQNSGYMAFNPKPRTDYHPTDQQKRGYSTGRSAFDTPSPNGSSPEEDRRYKR